MASRAVLKFGNTLKELRIHCCQTSKASSGLRYATLPFDFIFLFSHHSLFTYSSCVIFREFVTKYYSDIKSNNPNVAILIRECSGVSPRIWARYEYGRESVVDVPNLSPEDILKEVGRLGTFSTKSS